MDRVIDSFLFIYDIFEKLVISSKPQQAKETVIDLSGEAPGVYLIRIDGEGVKRVVKE